MAVTFQHPEYKKNASDWTMVRTLCEGDSAVKDAGETLLPNPAVSTGEEPRSAAAIYERYKQRAMFYNVVGHTKRSLVGSVFRKAPSLTTPATIAYVSEDIDGAGVSIYQQSQSVLDDVLMTGRAGLLIDYPASGFASMADVASGTARANAIHYRAEQITNWRTTQIGGKSVLSLVVLSEFHTEADDYEEKQVPQLRALRLIDGLYVVELHRKNAKGEWVIVDVIAPTMANGTRWTEIPFAFIGATNNSPDPDSAPLYDLAVANRKHYQLSADWYNALFFAGNPQPWIAGLTEAWRDALMENGVVVGSRSPIPLPEGGAFGYATVPADTAIQRELQTIEEQMQSLGARLSQKGEATKTATQSAGEQEAAHSVISLVAENVSDAYTKALEWMLGFVGGNGAVDYRISNDISVTTWDAQTLMAVVQARQSGDIPQSDAIAYLKRVGLIDAEKEDADIIEELAAGGGVSLDGMA